MQVTLNELHKVMSVSGLKGATKFLEKNFNMKSPSTTTNPWKRMAIDQGQMMNSKQNRVQGMKGKKFNTNRIIDYGVSRFVYTSKSINTIYENTIALKRNSFSSGEEPMKISDESMDDSAEKLRQLNSLSNTANTEFYDFAEEQLPFSRMNEQPGTSYHNQQEKNYHPIVGVEPTPGNNFQTLIDEMFVGGDNLFKPKFSTQMDDDYLVVRVMWMKTPKKLLEVTMWILGNYSPITKY